MPNKPIDWSKCDDVESVPGRVSGAWVIKETRVQADAVVETPRTDSRRNKFAIKAVLRYAKVTPPSKGREFCSTRIPRQRRGILTGPDVRTVREMGWARYSNGQLRVFRCIRMIH
jgi:hypothetical protein